MQLHDSVIDAHELHYGLGSVVFSVELCDSVDKALVKLWGPHEMRLF